MADFNLFYCLTPEEQKKLRRLFPFFNPPKDPWDKKLINLDTEIEDTEEVGILISHTPSNVKRNGRW